MRQADAVTSERLADDEGSVLFIEYDVTSTGEIELVALINAVEATGADADGSDWLAWRTAEFDDDAMGCSASRPLSSPLMEGKRGSG